MNKERYNPENNRMKKIDEITKKLEDGIKDMYQGENYKNYLKAMSKFHRYSYNNVILIVSQMRKASHVASYSKWKEFERNVKKGEHGLQIFAPIIKKEIDPKTKEFVIDEKTGKPKEYIAGYVPAYVFDISQTEGKELPSMVRKIDGEVKDFEKLKDALIKVSPVPVFFEDIKEMANGYFSTTENRIVVDESLSDMHKVKTLVHEISHSMLHGIGSDEKEISMIEVEAESVAYTVCNYLGLDTSDYSFGYIGSWSKDKELSELKESIATIKNTSGQIIKKIEEYTLVREQPDKEQLLNLVKERSHEIDGMDIKKSVSETYDYEYEPER